MNDKNQAGPHSTDASRQGPLGKAGGLRNPSQGKASTELGGGTPDFYLWTDKFTEGFSTGQFFSVWKKSSDVTPPNTLSH